MTLGRIAILAVCPADWAGVRKAITQGADDYADIHDAPAAIRARNPVEVRFGGYDPRWRGLVKFARTRHCRVVVAIHHTPLFHEFSPSGRSAIVEAIDAFRQGLIDRFETPDEGVAGTLASFGIPCHLKRNTIAAPPESRCRLALSGLHIGIFGTGMPWKNQETQILAAALAIKNRADGEIHVQCVMEESLLRSLGIRYQTHAKMDQPQFYDLLASMTLNLAVGATETFGYIPVESFLLGVPCLFSPMTPAFYDVERESPLWACRVDRIDDPVFIAKKIDGVLESRSTIAEAGREFCRRHVAQEHVSRAFAALLPGAPGPALLTPSKSDE